MRDLNSLFIVIQSLSLLYISVVLCLIVKRMIRVCNEMRQAQRDFIGLNSKYSGSGEPGTRDEGKSLDVTIDLRDKP